MAITPTELQGCLDEMVADGYLTSERAANQDTREAIESSLDLIRYLMAYGNDGTVVSKSLANNATTTSTNAQPTNLTFAIGANEKWVVDIYLQCSKATSTTGLKLAVGAPSGASVAGLQLGGVALLATPLIPSLITAINTLGTALATGTGVRVAAELHVVVTNGATPGNVTLQFATVTSNTATLYAGSYMRAHKVTSV